MKELYSFCLLSLTKTLPSAQMLQCQREPSTLCLKVMLHHYFYSSVFLLCQEMFSHVTLFLIQKFEFLFQKS